MLTSSWFRWNDALIAAAGNAPAIRRGDIGYSIRVIQMALINQNYKLPKSMAKHGSPDGIFGSEVQSKVRLFQKKHKLSQDGVVGRDTMAKLDKLVSGPWVPPPAIGGPGDKMRSNENARIAVLQTLSGSRTQSINFHYKGTSIGAHDYLKIGEAIHFEDITVKVGHLPGAMAMYSTADDTLVLSFFMANSPKRRSTIVHELTHAAMDRRSIVMSTLKSEAIAWIAQCMYLRLAGINSLSPGFGTQAQPIYLAANNLAAEWRNRHQFSDSGITTLENALRAVPHYSHGRDFKGDGI